MIDKLNIFEAFAGIGSQRKSLENNLKFNLNIFGLAEWNAPAIIMYQAIHNNFCLSKVKNNISREKMINFLEQRSLSWD